MEIMKIPPHVIINGKVVLIPDPKAFLSQFLYHEAKLCPSCKQQGIWQALEEIDYENYICTKCGADIIYEKPQITHKLFNIKKETENFLKTITKEEFIRKFNPEEVSEYNIDPLFGDVICDPSEEIITTNDYRYHEDFIDIGPSFTFQALKNKELEMKQLEELKIKNSRISNATDRMEIT